MRRALVILLLLAGCRARLPQDTLVTVDGSAITARDLAVAARLQNHVGAAQDTAALLEELIDQALILHEAARLGVSISRDELENQLLLARAGSSSEEFEASLKARGISRSEWRDAIHHRALADEVVRREIRENIRLSPQDFKDYYWEHVTQFRRSEQVRLWMIYTKSRAVAEKAWGELRLGEPFAEVAARYSVSPEAKQGGDLGWIQKKELPEKLAKAAFGLKPKLLSDIIATAYGYHILWVDEKRPEISYSLEESAADIREALIREREQPRYQNWLFDLRGRAVIQRVPPKKEM